MPSQPDDPTFDALATGMVTGVGTGAPQTPEGTASQRGSRRFEPGAIVAGRYRLVAMLGRGGMGEVYRADDLTLDQPVALKFLPLSVGADERSLAQFHNELRVARQVSHKNVCRLYDVGEAGGHRFLTMEYIDGEDLGSLLRRIGRLPQDKAVQIARQLCAGVAAAHERGVLHRDLKPANVMIDGQGDARVTDFGIATVAADSAHEAAGTPQYMAPELFSGKPASVQSDIYALGLTLYELFTGRRGFDSKTLAELKRQHETGTLATPTSVVRDLDPAIERAILRSVDKDPARRPASALALAAMLPGGDALADSLAAGETPSPELVAAAAEVEALPVWRAALAAGVAVAGALMLTGLSGSTSLAGRTPLEKPAAVLADRAEALVEALGYDEPPAGAVSRFALANDYLDWVRLNSDSPAKWDQLARGWPSAVQFWYRSSPRELRPLDATRVSLSDPPFTRPNMRLVVLDAAGRLQLFRSVPLQRDGEPAAGPVSWDALFEAAGLDMAAFMPTPPEWVPADFADTRLAWSGALPGRSDIPLRVEAASHRGRPVAFFIVGPWTQAPSGQTVTESDAVNKAANAAFFFVIVGILVAAVVLARHNLAAGRADPRGARRLAIALALPLGVSWVITENHAWNVDVEMEQLFDGMSAIALIVALIASMYLALEPYVRRHRPSLLLGWSRLLAGHVRDPRVGTDVLIGMLGGLVLFANDVARGTVLQRFGWAAPFPLDGRRLDTVDPAILVSAWIDWGRIAVQNALLCVLLIVLLRLILRRAWIALPVAAFLIATSGTSYMSGSGPWLTLFPIISAVLVVLIAVKFGLLALVVARLVWNALYGVPLTLDFSHWSAMPSNWTLVLLACLLAFAFYAARAGQPLFGRWRLGDG